MPAISLPIDAHLQRVRSALEQRPNLVLVAEPGAGKTTRVPPALLRAPSTAGKEVWVLEPRRLAARMSARRVAAELGEQVGGTVGYAVRFERKRSAHTRLSFLTEALLVRALLEDPGLRRVGAVVLDEFHERSIHTDLALALLLQLQRSTRPDLRIVVMSATLDAAALAAHLDATSMQVEGRTHPVEIHHLDAPDDRPLHEQVQVALRKVVLRELSGDVLVFLPGAAEIHRARQACEAWCQRHDLEVHMLHGDMPARDQDRVLESGGRRKLILSTNIAETSLTLPGVGVVIDSGLARVAGHSPWSGLATLHTRPISQASAAQRAGRAGRVRAGHCFRLYTRADLAQRPPFDVPELRRADLAETRLLVAQLSGGTARLPWLEPPPEAAWQAAGELLSRLGALDAAGGVTPLGRQLSRLPVHPRLGRLALAAAERGFAHEGALLAALAGERDLRLGQRLSGPRLHDAVGDSDLLAQLEAYEALAGDTSAAQARRHDLDPAVVRAVARTQPRLSRLLPREGSTPMSRDAALRQAVMLAFVDRLAARRRAREPQVVFAEGGSGTLADSSVVKEARFLVAVQAAQQRGGVVVRSASAVEPDWIFELLFDRLEEDSELRFDAERQRVERRRSLRVGQLVLEEERGPAAPGPETAAALARALLDAGERAPWDTEAIERARRRVRFARGFDPTLPELDDAALCGLVREHAEHCTNFEQVAALRLESSLSGWFGEGWVRLERLAPEQLQLPSGRRLRVHYEIDRPPWTQSRLQDFFGLAEGPRVAAGREPVVLHLLAPNQRPVQVTTDLAGFWERHYPALRKELMRRYPRHAWPEDPRAASPPPPGGRRRR